MSPVLLQQFWNIMRLRSGPQELPYSYSMLLALLLIHLLIDIVISGQSALAWSSVMSATVNTLFTVGYVFVILQWSKKTPRFVQSLSALLGAEILIGLVGAILLWIYQIPAMALLVSICYLFLIIWNGLIAAHIFRHALDTTMLRGVVLALLYIFLAYNVVVGFSAMVKGS